MLQFHPDYFEMLWPLPKRLEAIVKPLHVQVAEALGWLDLRQQNGMNRYSWTGWHAPMEVGGREAIPDFEHDWSATGPLIEKYEIWLTCDKGMWIARTDIWPDEKAGKYSTPLLAVCHLILALKEAGKLTP